MSTISQALFVIATVLPLFRPTAAASYGLVKEYAGSTFFNDWTFYDHFDNLTNGDTIFVSASTAASSKLAFVDPATNHGIIKVDNTSTVPFNEKRNTVRITSNDGYGIGSVAAWSQAPGWPTGGEIDTFEGVNLVTRNQMGLHTLPGCTAVGASQAASSITNSTDCSYLANSNEGCTVTDGNIESYGQAFANAGGGVFVTEFASSGISAWFFARANVPSSVSSNSSTLDTSTLGTPTGNWPSAGCEIDKFFETQNLIFDITLCGDFAGATSIFSQTCTGVCYNDYVIGNGTNYGTAYFEIASVRVFSVNGTTTVVKGDGGGNGSGTSSTTSNSGSQGKQGRMVNLLFLFTSGMIGLFA
ncbi:putative glycosidase C21B10.07 [Hypsizygus marmoreus]|uniref:Glycosidase C21B10.07 n=1 Tax=Hypsizygus marmoreus TaxID=39966 RepID=A0A369JHN6_HYPMA|nr:putative glycosidase C21B10.07 [Hypsizygus marmoreus]